MMNFEQWITRQIDCDAIGNPITTRDQLRFKYGSVLADAIEYWMEIAYNAEKTPSEFTQTSNVKLLQYILAQNITDAAKKLPYPSKSTRDSFSQHHADVAQSFLLAIQTETFEHSQDVLNTLIQLHNVALASRELFYTSIANKSTKEVQSFFTTMKKLAKQYQTLQNILRKWIFVYRASTAQESKFINYVTEYIIQKHLNILASPHCMYRNKTNSYNCYMQSTLNPGDLA
jgi:hypothetical protein